MFRETHYLGVTGSRNSDYPNIYQTENIHSHIKVLCENNVNVQLVHGDCYGVDSWFHSQWILRMQIVKTKYPIFIYPSNKPGHRADSFVNTYPPAAKTNITQAHPMAPLKRNKKIVTHSDIVFCVPDTVVEKLRSGTWSTIRYCRETKKPHIIFYPNGIVKQHIYDYDFVTFPTNV